MDKYALLRRWCTHALKDTRLNLTSSHQYPLGAPSNLLSLNVPPTWFAYNCHRFRQADLQYGNFITNIADAQSEVFVIARVRIQGTDFGGVLGRGRDGGAGSGWSLQIALEPHTATCHAVTMSGGAAARTIQDGIARTPGKWYTLMAAYKSGAYVKVGIDGVWTGTTAFTATGLRDSTQGLNVNRLNSATANGDFDLKVIGIGTAIPPDEILPQLHKEIVALDDYVDIDYGALLTSVGAGGGGGGSTASPQNVIWF